MIKKIAITSVLLTCINSAHSFQTEIGGTVDYIDYDLITTRSLGADYTNLMTDDLENTVLNLDLTYYLKPVNIKNNPLNEAAFLDRASNIKGNIFYRKYESDILNIRTYDGGEIDTTYPKSSTKHKGFGTSFEYFIPNSNFYANIGLGYYDSTLKWENATSPKVKSEQWNYKAEMGYLLTPGLLFAVGFDGWDNDVNDGIDPTLRTKYVTQIADHDINLEAYVGFGDLDDFSLRGDYYIDKTLSLGVDYYDDDRYDEFGINAKKFFNQKISVEGRLGFGNNNDNYSIRAAYRF